MPVSSFGNDLHLKKFTVTVTQTPGAFAQLAGRCLAFFCSGLQESRKSLHAMPRHLPGIRLLQDFGRTVSDTLGVSLAEITFGSNSIDRVDGDRSHRAHIDAHRASDAGVRLHGDHSLCVGSMQGSCGADLHAGRVFAVQTRHRDIFPLSQGNDFNPAPSRIAHLMMMERTHQFTGSAATADILRILPVFKVTDPLFCQINLLK